MKKTLFTTFITIFFLSTTYSQVLNFDEPFATQAWTEDGHSWSWDNSGWDNIRTYGPHSGSGHAMSAPGYHSKLSSNGNLNIQGIWLKTQFASNFTHLHLKGYSDCGVLIYDVTLNPSDYEFNYGYVTLNWSNVKSFMVDYNSTSNMNPVDLFYDDMDYTFNNSVLNFDEPFATDAWSEDGHSWSWDNSGWDNIRTYGPHTGSGHAMSAPGYHSKLSSNGILNIQGIWLKTEFASNFTHLHLKGYNMNDVLIYDVTLNPTDYEFNYAYVTLNWLNVKGFKVDYNSTSNMSPVDLFYDDMDYTYSIAGKDTKSECNSFTWLDGNTYNTNNNTATFNKVGGASNGCDSLLTLDLTILNSTTGTDIRTECDSFIWIDGNTYTSNNNIATFNIVGGASNGCDSLLTLNLTINSSTNSSQTQTAIDSYVWPINSQTYTQSGTYTDTILNANYCDSIVTLNLTLQYTGLNELNNKTKINITPNPANDFISIKVSDNLINVSFTIMDLSGRNIIDGTIFQKEEKINIGALANGTYVFKINNEFEQTYRIIKQ